ncbi:MAG TPA: hypothetical protein VLS48_07725 [Anaerolineales bacterium]|nr:hypothetical protein [Anaerolineales bacterium]
MIDLLIEHPFWLGVGIGVAGSALGAAADLTYARLTQQARLPSGGLLLVIASILNTVAGVAAIVYSLLQTGSIRLALLIGLGVFTGFAIGFLVLAGILIFISGREDENSSSAQRQPGAPGR